MVLRQTSEQIDRAILDAAAETFAIHGYDRTSVQLLADAVGYSKTGLLHRFSSKQVIYETAVEAARRSVDDLLGTVAAGDPVGVLRAVAESALARPGLTSLIIASIKLASDQPARDELYAQVDRVHAALGLTGADDEHRMRGMLALKLIVDAVLAHCHKAIQIPPSRLVPLVVELAAGVLGAPALTTRSEEWS
ncbi:TetR/AcrR family transcriptional regulator [Pseudonocardia sp. TRM90224]|uniref:TetR/AcrR family transcriptional regulator n=1 Tax=Pseudonocardia sp. TRM90224 TaxID=2812678 RepID=UPI001E370823|nr:TetR/AcrR family transcriptional regulator [Pseudonocardia sp. TRM90224]